MDDHRNQDPAYFGGDAKQATGVAATAAAANQRHSSNGPLEHSSADELDRRSEPVSNHNSRGEHFASNSGQAEPDGEQSMDNPSNEDDMAEEDPFGLRRVFPEQLGEAGWGHVPDENWQPNFEGIQAGDVIRYKKYHMIGGLAPADTDFLAQVARTTVQAVVRLAIVVEPINDNEIVVMDLDTSEEISHLRVPDNASGEVCRKLEEYLHVVALDGPGSVVREPQCFKGGVQCNWRSIDGAPTPSSKSWFMHNGHHHTLEDVPMQLLGRLAAPVDIASVAIAMQSGTERKNAAWMRLIALAQAEANEAAAAGPHPPHNRRSSRGVKSGWRTKNGRPT
jgi:hypothetical protein